LRGFRSRIGFAWIAVIAAVVVPCGQATAEDKLLTEMVDFTGTLTYLNTKVPGFMLVAVRNGETAFAGFGKISDKADKTPDADTMFRIGSVSKAFCDSPTGCRIASATASRCREGPAARSGSSTW
jgi:serine-type D-Ala-D-Ala carboxypeptidase/endopeptidase